MKEVTDMRYESNQTERRRRKLDRIALVILLLLGVSLLVYAIALQKLEISNDMQEYENLIQEVQSTEETPNAQPEKTDDLFTADKAETQNEQTTEDVETVEPPLKQEPESSPKPISTELPEEANTPPTAKPIEHGTTPTTKPGGTAAQPNPTNQPITGKTGADLDACKAANADFIAWLKIPGTEINYPVVLTDDVDYYLTHTFSGKQSKVGTLFSPGKTDYETPGQNIAVYGHHITTGGGNMFQPLLSYKKQSFWKKHKTVYFDTLYDYGTYTVFAAFNMTNGEWDAAACSFSDQQDFQSFLDRAKAASLYDTGITVNMQDHILTLITCDRSYHGTDGRFIVMAVKQ